MGTDEIDYELEVTLEDNGTGGKRFHPTPFPYPIGVRTGSAVVRWTFGGAFQPIWSRSSPSTPAGRMPSKGAR